MKRSQMIGLLSLGIFLVCPRPSTAQWLQVYKFGATTIKTLAAAGSDFLLGTKAPGQWGNGIVLRSANGDQWQTLTGQGWPARSKIPYDEGISVQCLAVSGTNIIAGTWNYSILISRDGGRSWGAPTTGLPKNKYVSCLAVKGTDIFAGFWDQSVFLSKDGGATWVPANAGLPQDRQTTCLAVIGQDILVGTYSRGIFRSSDDGTTWAEAGTGLPRSPGYPTVDGLVVSGPNVFAACGRVYRSTDGGRSWAAANSGLPADSGVTSLAASGPKLFASTLDKGVFVSTDNGASWTTTGPGMPPGTSIWKLAANDTSLLACTLEEVWRLPLSDVSPGGGKRPAPSGGAEAAAALKSYINNGDRAYQSGDFANAIVFFSKAIEVDPKSVYAHFWRAWSYLKLGGKSSLDSALADVTRILELDPANKDVYFARGEILRNKAYFALDKGNQKEADEYLTKALADYQIALDANPNSPVIPLSIGHAYFAKGDLGKALAAYSKEFEKAPNDNEIAGNLERLFEQYDRAKLDFDCGEAMNTWYLAGQFQDKKQHCDRAAQCYSKAIGLGLADRWVYSRRAAAYARCGQFTEALSDADRIVKLHGDRYAYGLRAGIYRDRGEWDRALADYSKAIDLAWKKTTNVSEAEFRANAIIDYCGERAGIYERKQNWDKAIDEYKTAIKFLSGGPRKAFLLYRMGSAYQKKGDALNARKYLDQAVAMDPKLIK
jgi:tetratricopeptide (TPR) repeat protein